MTSTTAIAPHGGKLVDLLVSPQRRAELKRASVDWPSWTVTPRQLCDLELLMNGSFSPLRGFLGKADFDSVCSSMRLKDGTLWPIPITLDVTDAAAAKLTPGSKLALRDDEGVLLAVLTVTDQWPLDRAAKAQAIYGTQDKKHPGVAHLFERANNIAVGGTIEGLELPTHYDFLPLRQTPAQLRQFFKEHGWTKIVAFQTRNPMHRAHFELTLRAAQKLNAKLLVQPVSGLTKPGDVDHYTRVRCYQHLLARYPKDSAMLSLLQLAMRMGGPREALLHAIIRKNCGCTHFIVGRDHAGPGNDSTGKPFYGPYDAQELLKKHAGELGIEMVPFQMVVYVPDREAFLPMDEVPKGTKTLDLSGTELRNRLQSGQEIPEWFTFPEVVTELRRTHPPRHEQGFTVFFTGLSGSGKSTIANVLRIKLLERGGRPVTLLDGDLVRKNLSSELGFSKEHRDINIRRIGFVAAEITKNGGIAICAPIAPYDSVRKEVRSVIEPGGDFHLVHLSTSLEVCESRDRKGLYAKARQGLVQHFTGISDPYEAPADAEIVIDTDKVTPEESAQQILAHLHARGLIA